MSGVTPEDRQAAVDILFAHNLITGQRILRIKAGDFDDIAAVQVASKIRQAAYAAGVAAERGKGAAMLEALRCVIPQNLNMDNDNISDAAIIPLEFTMGELRKIRAVIAAAGGEG